MHLRDPKNSHKYLMGMRDTAVPCCILRDDLREASIDSAAQLLSEPTA